MSTRSDIVIARSVGIVCVAIGFVLGMHGLDHPESIWLRTALGLIVTGMVAQGYALIQSIRYASQKKEEEKDQ